MSALPENILLLFERAKEAQQHSYSPFSRFKVGAAIKTSSGKIFTGTNIENASYGLTLCAESTALAQFIMGAERHHLITEVLTIGSSKEPCYPCGACRQRLAEFCSPDALFHVCQQEDYVQTFTLHELLPYAFSSKNFCKEK